MSEIVRAALVQSSWTGDKQSMIEANVEFAREAAAQGAQVLCFQELFYGPYFCQVQDSQYFSFTEAVPGGPTTELMCSLARELHMVLVVPVFEEEQPGVYYNTAAVIDADGTYLGKYRKTHIPQVQGFFEKYYFRPGPGRRLYLLRPPLPRGLAGARPRRGPDRVQPFGHEPKPFPVPVAPRAAGVRGRQRVFRRRHQPRWRGAARR